MKFDPRIEAGRIRTGDWGSNPGEDFGSFRIMGPLGEKLTIIASSGDGENFPWEHVSVSTRTRCPTWREMCFVKELFWDDEETVMQLHPPRSTWVNNHNYCLHLWKPLNTEIPLPPSIAVGFKDLNLEARWTSKNSPTF